MNFFLITNNPEIAAYAVNSGVDRIFVDLEKSGKQLRQGGKDTLISDHSLADVARIRACVPQGRLLVRINPLHEGSLREIDEVIGHGADIIMLPMFRSLQEVRQFIEYVAGRAKTNLLLETTAAAASIESWLQVQGIDEVHIGLNDLHLELALDFMFQPVADGTIDRLAASLRAAGIPFGMGGIARMGEGLLPAELVLGEHVRLGSSAAILSRTFHRHANSVAEIKAQMDFSDELMKLRRTYASHQHKSVQDLEKLHLEFRSATHRILMAIRSKLGR